MIDLKDIGKHLKEAEKMLIKTTQGLPERIQALKNVTKEESGMLKVGTDKINSIMADLGKEMAEMNDFLKK